MVTCVALTAPAYTRHSTLYTHSQPSREGGGLASCCLLSAHTHTHRHTDTHVHTHTHTQTHTHTRTHTHTHTDTHTHTLTHTQAHMCIMSGEKVRLLWNADNELHVVLLTSPPTDSASNS